MSTSAVPDWLVPPPEGFTAEDLDRLADLPPHTELIDGSLVLVSPQQLWHTLVLSLLEEGLRRTAPDHLRVRREMSVVLGRRQRPEPDLVVVRAEAEHDPSLTAYQPDAVELVVEVVSPDSQERDRQRKPQLYAGAGIRHFWRVENTAGKPAVYAYELDPATGAYAPGGIHRDRVRAGVPYDVDIDLSAIDRL